jgi:hypothetical protein
MTRGEGDVRNNRFGAAAAILAVAVAFGGGCSTKDAKNETVATVNGDDVKVVELREILGSRGGVVAVTNLPTEKKKEGLDRPAPIGSMPGVVQHTRNALHGRRDAECARRSRKDDSARAGWRVIRVVSIGFSCRSASPYHARAPTQPRVPVIDERMPRMRRMGQLNGMLLHAKRQRLLFACE